MDIEETPLEVLSRAATMVSPPTYDEARTYSSKELPSTKWRKERRGHLHSRGGSDAPLDFSNHSIGRAPPSYDQSMRNKCNSSRPSVIQSAIHPPQPAPLLPSPPLEDVCDPAIDEHFRRSLGKDYSSIFSPIKKEAQRNDPKDSDPTGLSVDDHFAKALGETWTKLKEQESLERSKSNHTSSSSTPDQHLKKKNKDNSMLSDKRRAVVTTT